MGFWNPTLRNVDANLGYRKSNNTPAAPAAPDYSQPPPGANWDPTSGQWKGATGVPYSSNYKAPTLAQTNPIGLLNAANATGIGLGPNYVGSNIRPNINLATPTGFKMSLSDIIMEPDANKRNQLLENYYDNSLKASGINNVLTPGLNPYRPLPSLGQVVSGGFASYIDPQSGQQTFFQNKPPKMPSMFINPAGGTPFETSLLSASGINDQGQYVGGGLPGFNPQFMNNQMTGLNFPSSLNPLFGAGISPMFNLGVGGNYNFNPTGTALNWLGGSNFKGGSNPLGGMDPQALKLLMSLGLM